MATAHPAKFKEVVEEVIGEPVRVPRNLAACLKKKKQAILIPSNFWDLKRVLTD